jgi:hypothetical protein
MLMVGGWTCGRSRLTALRWPGDLWSKSTGGVDAWPGDFWSKSADGAIGSVVNVFVIISKK